MINMDGIPTYFVMLKDDEGLVKRYAYVNVNDYRLVSTADTKTEALIEYKKLVNVTNETQAESYTVKDIKQVITNGNTYYYIKFNATTETPIGFENYVFRASVELNPSLPFIAVGDSLTIVYELNGNIYDISSLTVN